MSDRNPKCSYHGSNGGGYRTPCEYSAPLNPVSADNLVYRKTVGDYVSIEKKTGEKIYGIVAQAGDSSLRLERVIHQHNGFESYPLEEKLAQIHLSNTSNYEILNYKNIASLSPLSVPGKGLDHEALGIPQEDYPD